MKLKIPLIFLVFVLFTLPALAQQEENLTITTYYPSPYGNYNELRSRRMAIGDTYYKRATVCWDPPCPLGSVNVSSSNPSLLVEGNVGIGTTNPGSYKLNVAGDVQAAAFFYSSDLKLKKNIKEIKGALAKVQKLKGVSFEWKKDGKKSLGLVAQDVEKVFPELVSTDENSGLKSIDYAKLVAALIEAVKEQQGQIEKLKAEVKRLGNNQ